VITFTKTEWTIYGSERETRLRWERDAIPLMNGLIQNNEMLDNNYISIKVKIVIIEQMKFNAFTLNIEKDTYSCYLKSLPF
jgi:hypothetical protein